jgi:hypothetical protein
MSELLVYIGSFAGAGLLGLVAWIRISLCVRAENAIEFEEWERA